MRITTDWQNKGEDILAEEVKRYSSAKFLLMVGK